MSAAPVPATPRGRIHPEVAAVATLRDFIIPNPLGANIVRLGMFVGAPLLTCMLWSRRRALLIFLASLLSVWPWRPAVGAIVSRTTPLTSSPSVALDFSSRREAALLEAGIPGLHEIWHRPTWRLRSVTDAGPLLTGAARLIRITAESFDLQVTKPGTITIRVHYSPRWAVDGTACLRSNDRRMDRYRRLGPQRTRACVDRGDPDTDPRS